LRDVRTAAKSQAQSALMAHVPINREYGLAEELVFSVQSELLRSGGASRYEWVSSGRGFGAAGQRLVGGSTRLTHLGVAGVVLHKHLGAGGGIAIDDAGQVSRSFGLPNRVPPCVYVYACDVAREEQRMCKYDRKYVCRHTGHGKRRTDRSNIRAHR
jgi:hypothetical protein